MKLDISHIEFSRKDILRNIKLPTSLTPDLAEFIGIMVGDGHLGLYFREKERITSSEIKIACNSNERVYIEHIMKLFEGLFGISLKIYKDKRSDTSLLTCYSKCIVQFLNQTCKIPINNKVSSVKISLLIQNGSNKIKTAFIRGLADTDFAVTFRNRIGKGHISPIIKAHFKSANLIRDLEQLFKELGFNYCCCYNTIKHDKRFEDTTLHSIYLNGKKNFKKWNEEIGFSNPKFQKKVKKWLKDGNCPPGY